jgi:hypothetical protein
MKIDVMVYERKTAKERREADFSRLTLETIDELSGPRFDDVRVGFDGFGAETTIPQPPAISVGVAVENLEIFRGAKILTGIIPYNGWITRRARQWAGARVGN